MPFTGRINTRQLKVVCVGVSVSVVASVDVIVWCIRAGGVFVGDKSTVSVGTIFKSTDFEMKVDVDVGGTEVIEGVHAIIIKIKVIKTISFILSSGATERTAY